MGCHQVLYGFPQKSVSWLPKRGTDTREFEMESLTSAAWMALLAGDRAGAQALVQRAVNLEARAPRSVRLDVLRAALLDDSSVSLSPPLKAAVGL